nr:hypothetical protein CFP56_39165 [Quercus suber]
MEDEDASASPSRLRRRGLSLKKKTHSHFNNYHFWKHKLREKCYKRVREDRTRLLWKLRLPSSPNHNNNKVKIAVVLEGEGKQAIFWANKLQPISVVFDPPAHLISTCKKGPPTVLNTQPNENGHLVVLKSLPNEIRLCVDQQAQPKVNFKDLGILREGHVCAEVLPSQWEVGECSRTHKADVTLMEELPSPSTEVDHTSSAEVDQTFGCGSVSDFLVMGLLQLFSVFELSNILRQHRTLGKASHSLDCVLLAFWDPNGGLDLVTREGVPVGNFLEEDMEPSEWITPRSNKGGLFVEISGYHNGARRGCLQVPVGVKTSDWACEFFWVGERGTM